MKIGLCLLPLLVFWACADADHSPKAGNHSDFADNAAPSERFALQAGDIVELVVGGRLTTGEESQERTLKASYIIEDVRLDAQTNRWLIEATSTFEVLTGEAQAEAVAPLLLSEVLPFDEAKDGEVLKRKATFTTHRILSDVRDLSAFPFFDFEPGNASEQHGPFAKASKQFQDRIRAIDPDAKISVQAAASRFEAYFKDSRFAKPYLHEIRIGLSPFGFIANVEERLQFWEDGMQRNVGAFRSVEISAVFPMPVKIIRKGKTYACSAFSGKCKASDGSNLCLARDPLTFLRSSYQVRHLKLTSRFVWRPTIDRQISSQ
jgi:hypothetical protein